LDEPRRTVTHEFGHALADLIGQDEKFQRFISEGYRAVVECPPLAPSGYALADENEFWAECFAAAELDAAADNEQVLTARELLRGFA
jgi:hypothetical protein